MTHLITLALLAVTTASTRNVPMSTGSAAGPRPRNQRQRRRAARR
jgi:hypothetical protein